MFKLPYLLYRVSLALVILALIILARINSVLAASIIVIGSSSSGAVLSATPSNLRNIYANCTITCYLMIFNSPTIPTSGSNTIAGTAAGNMVHCLGPSSNPFIFENLNESDFYSSGISVGISSTGCGVYTALSTAFIYAQVGL
jgi:hypothetical protein